MQNPKITEKKSYVVIEYRPSMEIDNLKLQSILSHPEPGMRESAPKTINWYTLVKTIEYHRSLQESENYNDKALAEPRFYARLDSTSAKKREAWLKEQLAICGMLTAEFSGTIEYRREMIKNLQQEQQKFIESVRRWNASVILRQRANAKAHRESEQVALASGEFWKCSEQTLKDYFHVPYERRKLVDVSEKYRATLFVEVDVRDIDQPWGYSRSLVPTSRAYLCGIDNNGEEWGFRVILRHYEEWLYESKVVDAMAEVWGVDEKLVLESERQGEILFHADLIPDGVEMVADGDWQIRPSHCVKSEGLEHDDDYFRSANTITVEHPTHAPVTLPPGSYRAYIHNYDAD